MSWVPVHDYDCDRRGQLCRASIHGPRIRNVPAGTLLLCLESSSPQGSKMVTLTLLTPDGHQCYAGHFFSLELEEWVEDGS